MYTWLYAAVALVFAGLFLSLTWTAVDVVQAQYLGGIEGTVTVEECRLSGAGEASDPEWECVGEFVSDDGSMRIPGVEIQPALPERPTAPVDALVGGPSAGVAQLPEPTLAWVSVAAPVVFAGLTARFGYAALVRARGDASRAHRRASRTTGITSPVEELGRSGEGPTGAATSWGSPPAAWSPMAAGRLPRDRVMPVLLAWYPLLLAAVAAVIWETSRRDPSQGAPPDQDAVTDMYIWSGMVLVPCALLAWAWTWRLGRWALGTRSPGQPATARVLVATPLVGHRAPPQPAAVWLELFGPDGTTRYQRAIWHRRLVTFALREHLASKERVDDHPVRGPDDIDDIVAREAAYVDAFDPVPARAPDGPERRPNAVVKRCPGLRRMYVVDIPGTGRIWPASTARRSMPRNYVLDAFNPARLGEVYRGGASPPAAILVGGFLVAMVWFLAGPMAAASVPVLAGSAWLWWGAVPLRGVYANRPEPRAGGARRP
jgi:hypothetical protein